MDRRGTPWGTHLIEGQALLLCEGVEEERLHHVAEHLAELEKGGRDEGRRLLALEHVRRREIRRFESTRRR